MSKIKIEVVSEKRAYDGYIKVDEAVVKEVSENGKEVSYPRSKVVRPDAVAVIVYNSDEENIILVKQHRYPTQGKVNEEIYEIVAGKIDEGESTESAAIREVEEEIGYRIKEENLLYRSSFFASPGYSSEVIHLFAASVSNEDKVSDGGGVDGEHENIEIHNIPVSEFFKIFGNDEIVDAKTIIAANALWHLRNSDRVEKGLRYYQELMNKVDDAGETSK